VVRDLLRIATSSSRTVICALTEESADGVSALRQSKTAALNPAIEREEMQHPLTTTKKYFGRQHSADREEECIAGKVHVEIERKATQSSRAINYLEQTGDA
jgi:hypothetical protein